jgi:hypothetical protein
MKSSVRPFIDEGTSIGKSVIIEHCENVNLSFARVGIDQVGRLGLFIHLS